MYSASHHLGLSRAMSNSRDKMLVSSVVKFYFYFLWILSFLHHPRNNCLDQYKWKNLDSNLIYMHVYYDRIFLSFAFCILCKTSIYNFIMWYIDRQLGHKRMTWYMLWWYGFYWILIQSANILVNTSLLQSKISWFHINLNNSSAQMLWWRGITVSMMYGVKHNTTHSWKSNVLKKVVTIKTIYNLTIWIYCIDFYINIFLLMDFIKLFIVIYLSIYLYIYTNDTCFIVLYNIIRFNIYL